MHSHAHVMVGRHQQPQSPPSARPAHAQTASCQSQVTAQCGCAPTSTKRPECSACASADCQAQVTVTVGRRTNVHKAPGVLRLRERVLPVADDGREDGRLAHAAQQVAAEVVVRLRVVPDRLRPVHVRGALPTLAEYHPHADLLMNLTCSALCGHAGLPWTTRQCPTALAIFCDAHNTTQHSSGLQTL